MGYRRVNELFVPTYVELLRDSSVYVKYFESRAIGSMYKLLVANVWRRNKNETIEDGYVAKRFHRLAELYEEGRLVSVFEDKKLAELLDVTRRYVRQLRNELNQLGIVISWKEDEHSSVYFYQVGEVIDHEKYGTNHEVFYIDAWLAQLQRCKRDGCEPDFEKKLIAIVSKSEVKPETPSEDELKEANAHVNNSLSDSSDLGTAVPGGWNSSSSPATWVFALPMVQKLEFSNPERNKDIKNLLLLRNLKINNTPESTKTEEDSGSRASTPSVAAKDSKSPIRLEESVINAIPSAKSATTANNASPAPSAATVLSDIAEVKKEINNSREVSESSGDSVVKPVPLFEDAVSAEEQARQMIDHALKHNPAKVASTVLKALKLLRKEHSSNTKALGALKNIIRAAFSGIGLKTPATSNRQWFAITWERYAVKVDKIVPGAKFTPIDFLYGWLIFHSLDTNNTSLRSEKVLQKKAILKRLVETIGSDNVEVYRDLIVYIRRYHHERYNQPLIFRATAHFYKAMVEWHAIWTAKELGQGAKEKPTPAWWAKKKADEKKKEIKEDNEPEVYVAQDGFNPFKERELEYLTKLQVKHDTGALKELSDDSGINYALVSGNKDLIKLIEEELGREYSDRIYSLVPPAYGYAVTLDGNGDVHVDENSLKFLKNNFFLMRGIEVVLLPTISLLEVLYNENYSVKAVNSKFKRVLSDEKVVNFLKQYAPDILEFYKVLADEGKLVGLIRRIRDGNLGLGG